MKKKHHASIKMDKSINIKDEDAYTIKYVSRW